MIKIMIIYLITGTKEIIKINLKIKIQPTNRVWNITPY